MPFLFFFGESSFSLCTCVSFSVYVFSRFLTNALMYLYIFCIEAYESILCFFLSLSFFHCETNKKVNQ